MSPGWSALGQYDTLRKKPGWLESLHAFVSALIFRNTHPGRTTLERHRDLLQPRYRLSAFLELTCAMCKEFIDIEAPYQCTFAYIDFSPNSLTATCPFCNILRQAFENYVDETTKPWLIAVHLRLNLDVQICFMLKDSEPYLDHTELHLQLYSTEQLTYSHPFRVIDHVGSTPASQNTIAKVKHWMRQCEKDHGCTVDEKYDATPFVPTRLIEVVPDREDVVRLASPTQRVEYIALSYCWGLTRQNTTQKENLELRGKELEVQSLPRTLQDAICMTRAIGLDYLWIDSLCIIQDDKDDWAYEASRMAEIYSHAHLVLVVTAAADCNDGFLHEQADPVMLETKSSEGTPLNVYVRRAVAHHTQLKSFEMERYPLFRRAWCMQERELSRRTLHFLPNEVIWHCSGLTDCECGVPLEYQHKLMALSTILSTDMGAQGSEKGTFAFGQAWAKIVEEYASLDITNLSDTLPALSGLAKRIQSSVSGQYFAGMWATDIAFLLSWSLRIESVDDNSKYGYKKSVPKQRRSVPGPTFSWVTSPGLVTWPTDTAVVSNCVLESVQCVPETVNPYGHLRTCSLQIQARVLNIADFTRLVDDAIANWVHRESKYKMVKIHLDAQAFEAPRWYKENINQFWKDARSDWSDIICVELYHIAEPDEGYGNGVQALLLYAENPGVYKRIGTVSYAITEWFQKDGKVETITII